MAARVTPGTLTVPSPLKRIGSLMAFGVASTIRVAARSVRLQNGVS
jgi:hypothetical protein